MLKRIQRITHGTSLSIVTAATLAVSLLLASSTASKPLQQSKSNAQSKGAFKAAYPPVKNKDYAEALAELKKARVLETIADNLNKEIAIPVDLTLTFSECNTINAFYDPE